MNKPKISNIPKAKKSKTTYTSKAEFKPSDYEILVDGYVRDSMQNKVAMEIIAIIFKYCLIYKMNIYKDKYGKYLKFKNKTIRMTADRGAVWSTCLLCDYPISIDLCKEFKIEYLWKMGSKNSYGVVIGFITDPEKHKSLINCDAWLGHGPLGPYSIGYWIWGRAQQIAVYDNDQTQYSDGTLLTTYTAHNAFKEGDRFMIVFNFMTSTYDIYHNDVKAESFELTTNAIIPAVSLGWKDECVQITKWEVNFV